jgi:hypothetical protein
MLIQARSRAEIELAARVRRGEKANCSSEGEHACSFAGEDAKVRPEFLRALMLGRGTGNPDDTSVPEGIAILPKGAVRLKGVTITGPLDLSLLGSASAPLPGLILERCKIEGKVDLSGVKIGEVELSGCELEEFFAQRAHIDGRLALIGLALSEGAMIDLADAIITHCLTIQDCKATPLSWCIQWIGPISLRNASIGGDLNVEKLYCRGAEQAINGENIDVKGSLTLSWINTDGETRFSGARIRGQFKVGGATFVGPIRAGGEVGRALVAQNADIDQNVALNEQTTARGDVSFLGARIGGQLNISGVKLKAGGSGRALIIDSAKILGSVFLKGGTEAIGEVSLQNAEVDGSLVLAGVTIVATTRTIRAINLQDASVGILMIRDENRAPVSIKGLVHALRLSAQGGVSINAASEQHGGRGIVLDGALDFGNLKASHFELTNATIRPTFESAKYYEGHSEDANVVLSLNHAEIVGALIIRLDDSGQPAASPSRELSNGVIDLRGAKVGTLDDANGDGWGGAPIRKPSDATDRSAEQSLKSGLLLLLDGLTYDRLEIDYERLKEERRRTSSGKKRWIQKLFLGRMFGQSTTEWTLIERRLDVVDRMYLDGNATAEKFVPQPYRELAATLREMGDGYATRPILAEMEHQSSRVSGQTVGGWIWWVYRVFFGFGYSSKRAFLTLTGLLTFGTFGFWFAENYETPCGYFSTVCKSIDASVAAGHLVFADETETVDPKSENSRPEGPPALKSCNLTLAHEDGKDISHECIDAEAQMLKQPVRAVALRRIFTTEKDAHQWAPPCEAPAWLYAIDVMVPFLDLKVETSCGFRHEAHWGWHAFRTVGAILGAIVIPLAALTFTGLLRRE